MNLTEKLQHLKVKKNILYNMLRVLSSIVFPYNYFFFINLTLFLVKFLLHLLLKSAQTVASPKDFRNFCRRVHLHETHKSKNDKSKGKPQIKKPAKGKFAKPNKGKPKR